MTCKHTFICTYTWCVLCACICACLAFTQLVMSRITVALCVFHTSIDFFRSCIFCAHQVGQCPSVTDSESYYY